MLLVIPISSADAHLLPDFTKNILRCGPLNSANPEAPKHGIRIVPTHTVQELGTKLANDLAPICPEIVVDPLDCDPIGGWPNACNIHFIKASTALWRAKIERTWYWFELDNTPVSEGWLTALSQEYMQARKSFMGAVVPTYGTRGDGSIVTNGKHMVGTGIYPNWWARDPKVWMTMPSNIPFDVYLQDMIVEQCHPTLKLQHVGRTQNFTRSGCHIMYDDKLMPEGISYASSIRPEAVVIHGCKDGSLARLLCGDAPPPAPKRRGRPPKNRPFLVTP